MLLESHVLHVNLVGLHDRPQRSCSRGHGSCGPYPRPQQLIGRFSRLGTTTIRTWYSDRVTGLPGQEICVPVPGILADRVIPAGQGPYAVWTLLPQAELGSQPHLQLSLVTAVDASLCPTPRCTRNSPSPLRTPGAPPEPHSCQHLTCLPTRGGGPLTARTCPTTPLLPGAYGRCHRDRVSRREVTGLWGPGAGEGPWYHAAQPLAGCTRHRWSCDCLTVDMRRSH